jgi:hypothetical protein
MLPLSPQDLLARFYARVGFLAHWRCEQPVIVFESDDWGLERHASSLVLKRLGEPGQWADEESETAEDLERLYRVLERHRDHTGRTACFTANFVLHNPDFDAIQAGGFARYHSIPIESQGTLVEKWREGNLRRTFLPQHHAQHHFWPHAWLKDLRDNVPGARYLFEKRVHGGLTLLSGQGWRYHSEYLHWNSREEPLKGELQSHVEHSLRGFQRLFGFDSLSSIAPHYLLTATTCEAWWSAGIRYVQGGNYRLLPGKGDKAQSLRHALGEKTAQGLRVLCRNVKFEPRPQRVQQGVEQAVRSAQLLTRNQVPVIVDTHRINYTGSWGAAGAEALDRFLNALKPIRPIFLSSVELGEAISNSGRYRDVWTGETRHIKPVAWGLGSLLRSALAKHHSRIIAAGSNRLRAIPSEFGPLDEPSFHCSQRA